MATDPQREALLAEAYHRGILPAAIKPHYEEAVRRGLVHAPPEVRALADAEQRVRVAPQAEPLRQFARQATLGGSDALSAGMSAMGARLQKGVPLGAGYAAARKVQDEETQERHSLVNDGAGWAGGLASLAFGGGEVKAALKAPTALAKVVKVAKTVGVGAGVGAGAGALNAKTLHAIPHDAALGGVVGGTLGLGGAALSGVGGAVARRVARPDVALLQREGVQMTPGQLVGGLGKRAEEAMRSAPLTGDAIINAHSRGQEQFSRAAVQRALTPVGERLPDAVASGHEAIRHAGDLLSARYEGLLPKGGVTADAELKRLPMKVAPHTATMTPQGKDHLASMVQNLVTSRFKDGKINGPMYQRIQSDLKTTIGQFGKSQLPDHGATAEALRTVSSELKDAAGRQNLDFAREVGKTDKGWAHLALAEDAASKAGTENGVFTPKQYAGAVRAANDTVRKRGVARGEALGQDLANAGVNVLAQKLPDSGTARRLAGGVLGGAGLVAALAHGGLHGAEHAALAEAAVSGAGAGLAHAAYGPKTIGALNSAVAAKIAGAGGKPGTLSLQRHFGALAGQAGRLPAGGQDAPP